MKKTLSLIPAVLILASSFTACDSNTAKEKGDTPDTTVTETLEPETTAPDNRYPYDTSFVTENGMAKAHIVVAENASANERFAAEELAYHINIVSGAEAATVSVAAEDSLSIVIAPRQYA